MWHHLQELFREIVEGLLTDGRQGWK